MSEGFLLGPKDLNRRWREFVAPAAAAAQGPQVSPAAVAAAGDWWICWRIKSLLLLLLL